MAYGLPDRVLLEAEIGVGKNITQTSNSSPGDEWMTLLNLCWELLCCFSEWLKIAKNSVDNQFIAKELILAKAMGVAHHLGATLLHVPEKQAPVA